MTAANPLTLELPEIIARQYKELHARLSVKLRSADLATEVLHEAWLKEEERRANASSVTRTLSNPSSYIIRIAFNIAQDALRKKYRAATALEIESVIPVPSADDTETEEEMFRLEAAVGGLSARQREILFAIEVDNLSKTETAARLGISRRTVHTELKNALRLCMEKMKR